MPVTCYASVSDLAVCQRCPALFAYKVLLKKNSAWQVGIEGYRKIYGSIFHKEISEKFFSAASNPKNILYKKISVAASSGADVLEECVRENFFVPFVEKNLARLTSEQILSMAEAVRTWIKGMLIFFEDSEPVFLKPEGKLEGVYRSKIHDADFIIKGRYDALIFNPGRNEARLFEFKGFKKSDITVPLSQSLIYAWLLQKSSGIIPSIEIIYLDEDKPEIFDPRSVREMIISGLPGLFNSALDIILLKRPPEIFRDINLCNQCKFKERCEKDMKKIFEPKSKLKKRRGASMLTLLAFTFAAMMITAQVFFFSNITAEAVKDDRELLGARVQLANLVEMARNDLSNWDMGSHSANYRTFFDNTRKKYKDSQYFWENKNNDGFYVSIHDLDYTYEKADFNDKEFLKTTGENSFKKIFPPMKGHYLIRARKKFNNGKNLMLQVLVDVDEDKKIKSYEEIWY